MFEKFDKKGYIKVLLGCFLFAVFNIIRDFQKSIGLKTENILGSVVYFIIAILFCIICYIIMKTTKFSKEKIKLTLKTKISLIILNVIIIVFLYILQVHINVITIFSSGLIIIITNLLIALATGFLEEFLCRGLFFQGFCQMFIKNKYLVLLSAFSSSFLFGLLHLTNLKFSSTEVVVQQIFYATVLGLLFVVIRVVTNNLIIVIFLHTLIDFKPTIASVDGAPTSDWIGLFIIFLPILIISIINLVNINFDVYNDKSFNFQN